MVINLDGTPSVEMPRDEIVTDTRIARQFPASMIYGNIAIAYIPLLWLRIIPGGRVRLEPMNLSAAGFDRMKSVCDLCPRTKSKGSGSRSKLHSVRPLAWEARLRFARRELPAFGLGRDDPAPTDEYPLRPSHRLSFEMQAMCLASLS